MGDLLNYCPLVITSFARLGPYSGFSFNLQESDVQSSGAEGQIETWRDTSFFL